MNITTLNPDVIEQISIAMGLIAVSIGLGHPYFRSFFIEESPVLSFFHK
ncbi:MAG: hypothetical protein LKG25_09030 [Prevotella sp.]|jgi:hypothetical protein|nr:hypothetical protein [Prevotella sp.]MCI1282717.1 hypothetical protein [Prevotella sp.]